MMAKLKLSEFIIFAVLIYVAFMVSDWIAKFAGLESWGLIGTLIILILPVAIIYYTWKKWLQRAAG
jgi:pilus assembly protein TadC